MLDGTEKETAKTFKKTLDQLERAKNNLFSKLNNEQLNEVSTVSADFTRVMNAAKQGNTEELNKYVAKYGNIN